MMAAGRARRRRRSSRHSRSAQELAVLKVPPLPRRAGTPAARVPGGNGSGCSSSGAASPAASPVKSPGKPCPRLEMSLSEPELSELISSKQRWDRMGWTRPQSPWFATDRSSLLPSIPATSPGLESGSRRRSVASSRSSSSGGGSSSDSGSAEAGPVAWYTAAQRRSSTRSTRPNPAPGDTDRRDRSPGLAEPCEPKSEQQLAIESVYDTLRNSTGDPDVLTLALRALFVLLYRAGAHTARGLERDEMLSDVLNVMRLHPNNAVLTSTAHSVVGLFTSVRLPPMDASQDTFVKEYLDWKAEHDRQLASAHKVMLRFLQLGLARAFRSWSAATRQRRALVAMLRRWVQLELSDRWAQWVHSCVVSRARRQESWVANAQKAHDAGNWKLTRDTAERALSLGKHLLQLARSSLPLSDANSVLDIGAHSAASALAELRDQEEAHTETNDRALDLLESAVEAQRHHDSDVLMRACSRIALMQVMRAFTGWQNAVTGWRRETYIIQRVKQRWQNAELGRAFEGWYDGVTRQREVQKLLRRAAAIWRNREMMRRFNMWCWFCQDCAEAREQELVERAAERQRRREAWLLKQLFKGVEDEFEGMDTVPDAAEVELRRMAEQEISEEEAENDHELDPQVKEAENEREPEPPVDGAENKNEPESPHEEIENGEPDPSDENRLE